MNGKVLQSLCKCIGLVSVNLAACPMIQGGDLGAMAVKEGEALTHISLLNNPQIGKETVNILRSKGGPKLTVLYGCTQ